MFVLIAVFVSFLLFPCWALSATITMTAGSGYSACSQTAFNTAYSSASSGDTIAFPEGSCSISGWTAVTIAKTNITVMGRGVGTTIINTSLTSDGCFNVVGSAGNGLRITAIDFRGPGGSNGYVFQAKPSGTQRPEGIRLDNNRFYNFGVVTQWGYAENTGFPGPYNCLVDNNNFDTPTYSTNYVWGDCDSTSSFPFNYGTEDGVTFEDNTIHAETGAMVHFITGRCGLKATIRYNTFYLYAWDALDMHESYEGGGRSNAKRGSWVMEVYNNKMVYGGRNSGARTINFRGGQSLIYNNYYDGSGDSQGGITLQSYNIAEGVCTLTQCRNQTTCSDGRYCDMVTNTYIWGNRYNCGSDMTNCASGSNITSINADDGITLNTDYWMSAKSGYTPHTYPHPLRGSSGDTTAPVISSGSPSGSYPCSRNPENKTLSVATDETATCKYNLTDVAYDSMNYTFLATNATTHTQPISPKCGLTHTYYVRCSDSSGNKNTSSTTVSFSINDQHWRRGHSIEIR